MSNSFLTFSFPMEYQKNPLSKKCQRNVKGMSKSMLEKDVKEELKKMSKIII